MHSFIQIIRHGIAYLCLFCSITCAAEISSQTAQQIVVLSGLSEQVNQLPGSLKGGVLQSWQQNPAENKLSDQEIKTIIDLVDSTVIPEKIIRTAEQALIQSLSQEEADWLLDWYQSNLGKKITAVEEAASTPASLHMMQQDAPQLLQDAERVAFAKRLDRLIGATEMIMQLQHSTSLATYTAIMTAIEPGQLVETVPFEQQIAAMQPQMRAQTEQYIILSTVFTYRNMPMAQLEQYEAFLKDPRAAKFNKLIHDSLLAGLEQGISQWASSIAQLFADKVHQAQGK